ncbi:DeoR/GlpR family DNA-binding transcription regulator [Kocuria varians]|uniref:DeoR/GlpR family DNA-binding transcription regulator n=1 Tax=Kocuria varians TaxID=1272 RepID=UPI001142F83C|nr:DeoR/GlpR family DNA-binding transcription regulator [Kocuria varians]
MSSTERHRVITETVRDSGRVSVQDLARLTGSSEMTIRRDLDALAAQGVLERDRGGARSLLLRGEEPPFSLRSSEAEDAKRAIAAAVAGRIADGETVLLDSGTTCVEVARLLKDREVTVMPLSLQAVRVLSDPPGRAQLWLPGGQCRATEGALVGPLALASIGALRFDTFVLGCCGLSAADGLTAYDLDDAAVKKAGLAASARTVLAADSGKLGRTARARVVPADGTDEIVTDSGAAPAEIAALERAGAALDVVPLP